MCYNCSKFVVGGETLKQKRHKRKSTFTVMVISNRADGKAHQFRMSHIMIPIVICSLICVIIVCAAYTTGYQYFYQGTPESSEDQLIAQEEFQALKEENARLVSQNDTLQQQVSVLSSAVTSKDEKLEAVDAENAAKTTPTGFPLDGTASIDFYGIIEKQTAEDTDAEETPQDGNPEEIAEPELTEPQPDEYIVVFGAGAGTSVIAAGTGTIRLVSEDEEYGFRVEIDHGNGYVSIYRNKSEPKVKEGADIARGTIIFELSDSQKVGYQILLDDVFIDPMDMMEIYG